MLTSTDLVLWVLRASVFLLSAAATCYFAVRRGGGPERAVAALICLATLASALVPKHRWDTVIELLLVIDVAMLIALIAVAMFADRFWPLYFAAVQLLTVGVHGVRAYDETIVREFYARLSGELAYVTLAILVIGTWRHSKRKPELDWSWQKREQRLLDEP